MISRTPEQQRLYDARLKFQLDEAARLEMAIETGLREGLEKGRAEWEEKGLRRGELLGRIAVLMELLGTEDQTLNDLSTLDESRLAELAEQLKVQLRNRGH